jgi:L-iditol 2-dehydrogenase
LKAAYVRAPFQFQIRDVDLGKMGDEDILVDVRACGVCGGDLEAARRGATEWQPFGHEVAGVVVAVGSRATNVTPGQKVVLESGTFDRFSRRSRDGRVDLDNTGPSFWNRGPLGFSERMIVPREVAVPFDSISFTSAALVEPLGVAFDLVKTADVGLGDDVLVLGTGAIGLMALRLARVRGARRLYAAQRSGARRRIELAREMGADEVIITDETRLADVRFPRGGVDRVLVTAPPRTIPEALSVTAYGGTVAFIGIEQGDGARISFDANDFHFRKLQLRSSFASPALYLPTCIELLQAGIVQAERLVSHTFQIDEIPQAFRIMRDDRQNRVKLVMVKD